MDIPKAFPEDFGTIAKMPSMWDGMMSALAQEIESKGGMLNVILMKDEDGNINFLAFGLIYSALILTFVSLCIIMLGASSSATQPKRKQN